MPARPERHTLRQTIPISCHARTLALYKSMRETSACLLQMERATSQLLNHGDIRAYCSSIWLKRGKPLHVDVGSRGRKVTDINERLARGCVQPCICLFTSKVCLSLNFGRVSDFVSLQWLQRQRSRFKSWWECLLKCRVEWEPFSLPIVCRVGGGYTLSSTRCWDHSKFCWVRGSAGTDLVPVRLLTHRLEVKMASREIFTQDMFPHPVAVFHGSVSTSCRPCGT